MGADNSSPTDKKPDPPAQPPKAESRIAPTRLDNAGARQHGDTATQVNKPVHTALAALGHRAGGAVGHAKDTLGTATGQVKDVGRNVVDQARIGGRLAVGSAVDTGRAVANGAKAAADKLEKPVRIATATAAVGFVAHAPLHLDKTPPVSRGDAIVAKASASTSVTNADASSPANRGPVETQKAAAVERPAAGKSGGAPDDARDKEEWRKGVGEGMTAHVEIDKKKREAETTPTAGNEVATGPPGWADRH